ncbi:MAG: TrmB family transcriptional regulator [Candidatus Saccharibacteria bacterium]
MTDIVDHLVRLGLTEYEARAYIATVALGEGTVKEISAESGVPRSRAYDVLERLVEKGMVEAGSSSPRCYRANEPITASHHLMEDIRRSNDEALRELSRIGQKAETRDNPIWTVKGEWAIDHKISEMLEDANSHVYILCFNNKNLIRFAKLISTLSQKKSITVVVSHQAESFAGLLGKARLMKLLPAPMFMSQDEGVLNEKGYTTKDGKHTIELVIHSDRDDSLLVTKEGEGRRAIVIVGTILNFFSHETIESVVRSAEEIVASPATIGKRK